MKRSNFGGFLVKFCPTKVTLVTIRFQALALRLPDRITLNISASLMGFTFSTGTPVGSLASLVVGVLSLNTGNVLVFLHGSSSDLLSGALHFVDLGGLVSNLTISGH